jgi:hypothetical protein
VTGDVRRAPKIRREVGESVAWEEPEQRGKVSAASTAAVLLLKSSYKFHLTLKCRTCLYIDLLRLLVLSRFVSVGANAYCTCGKNGQLIDGEAVRVSSLSPLPLPLTIYLSLFLPQATPLC